MRYQIDSRVVTALLTLVICWASTKLAATAFFTSGKLTRLVNNSHRQQQHTTIFSTPPSSSPGPQEDGSDNSLDAMRRMLESSWNQQTMGRVPLEEAMGVSEVSDAISRAALELDGNGGIYFVDILLPFYDRLRGENFYDEISSVEFCIALAMCLDGKTEILVRHDQTVKAVEKVLSARESLHEDDILEEDEEDDEEEDFSDDDDDFVLLEESIQQEAVDSFRQKLMSNWENTDTIVDDKNEQNSTSLIPEPSKASSEAQPEQNLKPKSTSTSKRYRLASLFGNARMIMGADMSEDIVQAIRNNALPTDDEVNIIIFGAHGQDEMIGIRALAAKYKNEKKLILVNCQFQQTPTELASAETVYSILPLIAREKDHSRGGSFWPKRDNDGYRPPPKVVVMRRYPKDWEIFVDIGNGFELAETVRISPSNKRRLPMEMVANCIQRFLKSIS